MRDRSALTAEAVPSTAQLNAIVERLVEPDCTLADRQEAAFALTKLGGKELVLARRDAALRRVAFHYLGDADAVWREVQRYARGPWARKDRFLEGRVPPAYAGTHHAHLFEAFSISAGGVPASIKQLRRILLSL